MWNINCRERLSLTFFAQSFAPFFRIRAIRALITLRLKFAQSADNTYLLDITAFTDIMTFEIVEWLNETGSVVEKCSF
jgi:hypothetical protein